MTLVLIIYTRHYWLLAVVIKLTPTVNHKRTLAESRQLKKRKLNPASFNITSSRLKQKN